MDIYKKKIKLANQDNENMYNLSEKGHGQQLKDLKH